MSPIEVLSPVAAGLLPAQYLPVCNAPRSGHSDEQKESKKLPLH